MTLIVVATIDAQPQHIDAVRAALVSHAAAPHSKTLGAAVGDKVVKVDIAELSKLA